MQQPHAQYLSESYEAVAFVGEALAPFFLEDPKTGAADASYRAFAQLDAEAAAREWPLGNAEEVARGLRLMVEGLVDGVTDELVWEFRRLFVGPQAKAAPPWGSVYTDRDGVMFGVSALDLSAWMRANGIARLAGGEGQPDDHIGFLLLMAAWIARHRPELMCEFLQMHVLTWASHFLDRLERVAEQPLYEGLAVLTRASLEGAQSQLGIEVDCPRFYR